MRRSQILLASAHGQHARVIAETLGCDDQTVRNAI
jgi:DNA-binding NarL/FixJ family response regulator